MSTRISRSRWYVKKLLRGGCAAAHWPGKSYGPAPVVRALTYHGFGAARFDPFCVATADFARQMAWLAERQLAIPLDSLESFAGGSNSAPPSGGVLVTIDDGLASVYSEALPVLRHYNIPAVVFVTAGLIEAEPCQNNASQRNRAARYLGRRQLEQLVAAGLTIGSHAYSHRSMAGLGEQQALDEAGRSRELLERWLGRPVTSFAYPFGTQADFNSMTARVLAEAGYRTAFTSQHGAVRQGSDPLSLPRIKVEAGEPQWMFQSLCQGGLDKWCWIDRGLWRLQQAGKRTGEAAVAGAYDDLLPRGR